MTFGCALLALLLLPAVVSARARVPGQNGAEAIAPLELARRSLAAGPCLGIPCPSNSNCVSVGGAVTCVCQPPYVGFINGKCSTQSLAHSDWLDPHNNARAAVGSVSLVWSATAAQKAQAWANLLATTNNCKMYHGGLNGGYGQNLANAQGSFSYSNTDPVNWWVSEGAFYTWGPTGGICKGTTTCGHYTQVVWNSTTSVGCGSATCPGSQSKVWACDYFPGGNVDGEAPYVKSPCFKVVCPSTSTCVPTNRVAFCKCPSGQALISSLCRKDPCIGFPKCAGNLVCDGTSGQPKCTCAPGLVRSPGSTTTCVPPACKGVVCPGGVLSCRLTNDGTPFCALPVASGLTSTSIALYNALNFANAPAILRATNRCVNIPASFAGRVQSYKIVWKVQDLTTNLASCKVVYFWDGADCYGSASGPVRGSELTRVSSGPGEAQGSKSISCGF